MKIILLFFLSISLLFSLDQSEIENNLVDSNHAETFLQILIEDGDFEEAGEFFNLANTKFKNNPVLLCWNGKLHTELKDLDTAKVYFLKALDINPTHELSKIQLELIEEQENAHENKDISDLMDFINDKGLDFLMIFLAFLGGEIIAKRYTMCKNNAIYVIANNYIHRKALSSGNFNRFKYVITQYQLKNINFSFCFFINLLVITTIAIAIMISWLLVVFHNELSFLVGEDITLMNDISIRIYSTVVFISALLITVAFRALMNYTNLVNEELMYEVELVEELDALYNSGSYKNIYKILTHLKNNNILQKDLEELLLAYSTEAESIMRFYKVKLNK